MNREQAFALVGWYQASPWKIGKACLAEMIGFRDARAMDRVMAAVRCNPISGSVGRIPDADVSNLRAIWSSVETADQRVSRVISALSIVVGDIGRMREDNARLRVENARLQTQVTNISVDEGDGSPEARMLEHAQFVEMMIRVEEIRT
jgi:regulator of replication initiation timing